MSGINDCPRCGADMVLPERVCIICLTAENARLREELQQTRDERDAQAAHAVELIERLHAIKDQRDALLAAAKDAISALDDAAPLGANARWWEPLEGNRTALRAAVAACGEVGT